jgi:hypothetical protein
MYVFVYACIYAYMRIWVHACMYVYRYRGLSTHRPPSSEQVDERHEAGPRQSGVVDGTPRASFSQCAAQRIRDDPVEARGSHGLVLATCAIQILRTCSARTLACLCEAVTAEGHNRRLDGRGHTCARAHDVGTGQVLNHVLEGGQARGVPLLRQRGVGLGQQRLRHARGLRRRQPCKFSLVTRVSCGSVSAPGMCALCPGIVPCSSFLVRECMSWLRGTEARIKHIHAIMLAERHVMLLNT